MAKAQHTDAPRKRRPPPLSPAEVRGAEALLEQLLVAFGLEHAPRRWAGLDEGSAKHERTVKLALSGLPSDPTERLAIYRREVAEAGPVLAALVADVAALQSGRLLSPREYRARWQGIIDRWDDAVYDNAWLTLPPLCRTCGLPVLARQPERHGDGNADLSMLCGDRCRKVNKMRRHRSK